MKDLYTIASVANVDANVALTALAHNVNALIEDGYVPTGGLTVTICALGQVEKVSTGNPNIPIFVLAQALVLREFEARALEARESKHIAKLFTDDEIARGRA